MDLALVQISCLHVEHKQVIIILTHHQENDNSDHKTYHIHHYNVP